MITETTQQHLFSRTSPMACLFAAKPAYGRINAMANKLMPNEQDVRWNAYWTEEKVEHVISLGFDIDVGLTCALLYRNGQLIEAFTQEKHSVDDINARLAALGGGA